MHGAGNDYIYVNTLIHPIANPEALAIAWSAPHTGIGSDGLVLIGSSEVADFSLRIFNADGSEAMMCGNASRCIGKYVFDKGLTQKEVVTLETLSGIRTLKLHTQAGRVETVTVDMGRPVVASELITLEADGTPFTGRVVSMGNPHFVIEVADINQIDLEKIGPLLEIHPTFPNRTNVEFVQLISPTEVRMRVWERGSGITQACGTGACATAVACITLNHCKRKVRVDMDGGPLTIEWNENDGSVWMTGGATTVFEGLIEA